MIIMKKIQALGLLFIITLPSQLIAQSDEDIFEANRLKKIFTEDRVAATLVEEEYSFEKSKSEDKLPVVSVTEFTGINFVALRERAGIQYFDFYNSFSKINSFKQLEKIKGAFGVKRNYNVGYAIDHSASGSDFFSDDSRVKYFNISFSGYGDATRVETEKKIFDSKYFTSLYFHTYFPVKEKIIRIKVPDWLVVDFREFNFEGYKIEKKKKQEKNYTLYTYRLQNIPAMKNEENSIGSAYQWPHIIPVVQSFTIDGNTVQGFKDVSDLYKWYSYLCKKSNNKPDDLKAKVAELVKGKATDMEKVKAIFYWVQDNIRYIAFEDGLAGFIPAPAQEVLNYKYGDCKGMANLLTEMMKLAGFQSYITWIGTKHLPYDYTLPSLCVDNHCINTTIVDGKEFFLDGTEKFIPMGEYAFRIQGKEILIGKGEKYEVKKIPVTEKEQNKVITKTTFELKDNLLKGHVKVTLTGNERTGFHQFYHDLPTERKKEVLQRFMQFGNQNLVVNNIKTSDLSNRETAITIEGDIDLSNYVITDNKDIYMGLDFFPETLNDYMPDKNRQHDYEIHSNYVSEYETELLLPTGYKVISMPEPINEKMNDYGVSAAYSAKGNKINFKKSTYFANNRIRKPDFENWKAFAKKLKDFNSNLIAVQKP
jgi:transglutaminase-like putative cysteine protease